MVCKQLDHLGEVLVRAASIPSPYAMFISMIVASVAAGTPPDDPN
jgi:hypothetical protein